MRNFWRFSLMTASGLTGLFLFGPSIIGQAKVIQANGLNESDAILRNSAGKVLTHTEYLPRDKRFSVRYTWSVDKSIKPVAGDIMHFYLPGNVFVNQTFSFPVSAHVKVGTAVVEAESHKGTVTFNRRVEDGRVLVGYIYITNLEGLGSDVEEPEEPGVEGPNGGEEPGTEEPGGGEEPGTTEPGTEEPGGGEEPGTTEPGGEAPGVTEPGGENPGTTEPGGEAPGVTEPGGGEEPGTTVPGGEVPGGGHPSVTVPGNPGTSTPGVTTPTIPGKPQKPQKPGTTHPGATVPGASVSSGGAGNSGVAQLSGSSQQSGTAVSPQHSAANLTGHNLYTGNGQASSKQVKALPQTNEQSSKGWLALGLSLLTFGLGGGYFTRRRKEHE